jgi:hypothetical protein
MIKELFQNGSKMNPMPHEVALNILIGEAINKIALDPVLLKLNFDNVNTDEVDLGDIEDENEHEWTEDLVKSGFWNAVIVENVKQVIYINGDGVNRDSRSVSSYVKDEDLRCRMTVSDSKITVRDLTELIYRIKS